MRAKHYVYVHRRGDTGEVFYVGKGSGNRHRRPFGRNRYWRRVAEKYGWKDEIVAHFYEEPDALEFERALIAEHRSAGIPLANITEGGEGAIGLVHTESAKAKMAAAARGRVTPPDVRQKLSEALKKRVMSDEHRRRLSEANRRRFASVEERRKVAEGNRGKAVSAETRAKISASKSGKRPAPRGPLTEDGRRNISEGQRRRFSNPEERARMSAIQKARRAATSEAD